MQPIPRTSELDRLIPAEIKNDPFAELISLLSRYENLHSVLEIGSSSGEGSTAAFIRGLKLNRNKPQFYCMEVSRVRFQALQKFCAGESFVHCYNASSVPAASFPDENEIRTFYTTVKSVLNRYPLEQVLSWLQLDLEYVRENQVPQNGIETIKKENGISRFDMVLIDGSEFTGYAEFQLVQGANLILLDDVAAYKNHRVRQHLLNDPDYELIAENLNLRNGMSVFCRRDFDCAFRSISGFISRH